MNDRGFMTLLCTYSLNWAAGPERYLEEIEIEDNKSGQKTFKSKPPALKGLAWDIGHKGLLSVR